MIIIAIMFALAAAAFVILGVIMTDQQRRITAIEVSLKRLQSWGRDIQQQVNKLGLYDTDILERLKANADNISEATESIGNIRTNVDVLNKQVFKLIHTCTDFETRMDNQESSD